MEERNRLDSTYRRQHLMSSSNFPGALDTTTNLPDNITDSSKLNSPDHANLHNTLSDAVIAVETKLGTGATTPILGSVLIGTASGVSEWSNAYLNNYNIILYGADPTGTNDSTSAIRAAQNAASNCDGGVVFYPIGTFKLTGSITLYSGIAQQGASNQGTSINMTGTSEDLFIGTDLSGVQFYDIFLQGPNTGTGCGI